MAKVQYSIRLSPQVLERLKKESKLRDRSIAYLLESYAKDKLDML